MQFRGRCCESFPAFDFFLERNQGKRNQEKRNQECRVSLTHKGFVAIYSVLQYVAVCCSVLQCVAVCGSVLQCVAVRCSVLQCVAVCCSVLQCVAVCCRTTSRASWKERRGEVFCAQITHKIV